MFHHQCPGSVNYIFLKRCGLVLGHIIPLNAKYQNVLCCCCLHVCILHCSQRNILTCEHILGHHIIAMGKVSGPYPVIAFEIMGLYLIEGVCCCV